MRGQVKLTLNIVRLLELFFSSDLTIRAIVQCVNKYSRNTSLAPVRIEYVNNVKGIIEIKNYYLQPVVISLFF